LARRSALAGCLEIVRLRLGSGTAPRRQPEHFELAYDTLQREAQPIADANTVRGLHPLGIQMHFPAIDRGGRQAPRFVKPGMPQPLVEAGDCRLSHRLS